MYVFQNWSSTLVIWYFIQYLQFHFQKCIYFNWQLFFKSPSLTSLLIYHTATTPSSMLITVFSPPNLPPTCINFGLLSHKSCKERVGREWRGKGGLFKNIICCMHRTTLFLWNASSMCHASWQNVNRQLQSSFSCHK